RQRAQRSDRPGEAVALLDGRFLPGSWQTGGLANLGELAGVIVPVEVEERADVLRERDLLGAHELLEERNPRLARLQLVIRERRDHDEHLAALLVDGVDELLEAHALALVVQIRPRPPRVGHRRGPWRGRLPRDR